LYVLLDEPSRQKAAVRARLPVVRGDHVTLARATPPGSRVADFLDGPWQEGDEVPLEVVAEYGSEDVQAWLVELGGSSRRKCDGGLLHVTVSRSPAARSRDANALLHAGAPTPLSLVLRGTLRWVPAKSEADRGDLS
jgi:hypothetical protein